MPRPEGPSKPDFYEDLVRRIRRGDSHADGQLVEHFQRGIHYHLLRMSRDSVLCEDLVQETFALVLQKIKNAEIQEPRALGHFVHHTAKNLYIAHYRKQQRRGDVALETTHADRSDPSDNPQQELERNQRDALVREVLGELKSKRDRLILLRFYIQQVEKQIICQELGIDAELFNSVLSRARTRFRILWEAFERRRSLKEITKH